MFYVFILSNVLSNFFMFSFVIIQQFVVYHKQNGFFSFRLQIVTVHYLRRRAQNIVLKLQVSHSAKGL